MSDSYLPDSPADDAETKDWERQVDDADKARQKKIQRLRIAESGSGEYDDEKKPHRFLHFMGWMLLIVVLTGGAGFAGWHFWLRHEQPAKQAAVAPAPPPPSKPAETPTENYNSVAFLLQFDYPAAWKVAETDSNKLTVTSTNLQLKAVSSNDVTKQVVGQVIVTFQHKQPSLPEFAAGDALAARESDHMDYARPSQSQRASTYLSFLNYTDSITKGRKGIDDIYVTGDSGYVKDQIIPQADIIRADPLISVSFRSCPDTKCSTPGQPLTLSQASWDDASFKQPVMKLLQSIIVQ